MAFGRTAAAGAAIKPNTAAPGRKARRKAKKQKSDVISYIIVCLAFAVGVGLIAYPTVSDWWNSFHQSRAIMNYAEAVSSLSDEDYARMEAEAEAYNERLAKKGGGLSLSDEELLEYENILNIGGTGVMGYIEIPVIDCSLPIYHGTDEAVLQTSVGHIEWSSLPVGGFSSHCVLSGHRGLPSAKLFTDLDQLVEKDLFMIRVLDEVRTYEVDQILIVLPEDVSSLTIEKGKDLCTLVTCTPYGINTHRLLVRGHRVENTEAAKAVRVVADAVQVEPVVVAPFIGFPLFMLVLGFLFMDDKTRNKDIDIFS